MVVVNGYFVPRSKRAHELATSGRGDIPDLCLNCEQPFMKHRNNTCPTFHERIKQFGTEVAAKIEQFERSLGNK